MILTTIIQAKNNIQENRLTTLSGVVTTSFSLVILGSVILLYLNLIQLSNLIFQHTNYSVFLEETIVQSEHIGIISHLKVIPNMEDIESISSEMAKNDLIESFGETGKLLKQIELPTFPEIIEFSLNRSTKLSDDELTAILNLPGVDEIVSGMETKDQIDTFFTIAEFVGLFLISLLIVSIVLIIHNTIQIAIRMRMEEIEILQILGADSGFIKLPYFLEGIIIASMGCFISIGLVYFLFQFVVAGITFDEATYGISEVAQFFSPPQMGIFLALISLTGLFSSILATNKVLKELNIQ